MLLFRSFLNRFWDNTTENEAPIKDVPVLPELIQATESLTVYDEITGEEHVADHAPQPNPIEPRPSMQLSSNDLPAASSMGKPRPVPAPRKSLPHVPPTIVSTSEHEVTPMERIESRGKISALEEGMPHGVIEDAYLFDKKILRGNFKRGDEVIFKAERPVGAPQWEVTDVHHYISPEEEEKQNARRFTTIIGIVVEIQEDVIKIKYGRNNVDNVQDIPVTACQHLKYRLIIGDYLRVKFEINSLDVSCITGRVLSVEPSKMKTIIGEMTSRDGFMTIDNHIVFDRSTCSFDSRQCPRPRDVVRVEAVESQQDYCGNRYGWRAISVSKSSFPTYTAAEKREEAWLEPVNVWSAPLSDLLEDKHGVKVRPRKVIDFGALKIGSNLTRVFDLENSSGSPVILHSIVIKGDQTACKFEVIIDKRESDNIITVLRPGGTYSVTVKCTPNMLGSTRELCVLTFDGFRIGRYLVITCLSDQQEILNGIKSAAGGQVRKWKDNRSAEAYDRLIEDRKRPTAPGIQAHRAAFFLPRRLPAYSVPRCLWEIVKDQDEPQLLRIYPSLPHPLTFESYKEKLHAALHLEEMENELLRRQYDIENITLRRVGEAFVFEVLGHKDFHPPLMSGDPLSVFDSLDPTGERQQGYIDEIRNQDIFAKFGDKFSDTYKGTLVTIQFGAGRTTYKRGHFAVDQASDYLGKDWLFPTETIEIKPPRIPFLEDEENDSEEVAQEINGNGSATTVQPGSSIFAKAKSSSNQPQRTPLGGKTGRATSIHTFKSDTAGPSKSALSGTLKLKWFNKRLNPEQKNAVRRILRGQGRPLPYIIYGPPGTGKTVTVVEAILQVYTLDSNSRILVTAPSNSAADIIAQHLVASKVFLRGEFVRLVGFMRQEAQIPENIRDFCQDGDYLDTVARNRVIITTCTTAGQFFSLGLDSGHFTHVFIDEAGYCTEPEALISACLVAVSRAGQVILAGDPQQLGPVLMSQTASNCGLSLSFLERLMSLPLYSRNEEKFPDEKYNPVVLTKLVKNYRAHPTLLKLPSMLFYDDELESAAHESEFNLCHALDFLPCPGVPLLFQGLEGRTARDSDSPSWFNTAEVIQVVEYVRKLRRLKLENDDIGIITPYRKQVDKIRKALEVGLLQDDIPKVGSVEEFQGGERKVMIMSLVRSAPEDQMDKVVDRMSFVYSPKRFNVAITRAKAALIVIGNPHLLSRDEHWEKFLKYCLELGCYTGCNVPMGLNPTDREFFTQPVPVKQIINKSIPQYDSDGELIENDEDSE